MSFFAYKVKIFSIVGLFLISLISTEISWTQEVITAGKFFETVSQTYGSITDYEADMVISQEESVMEAVLSYKRPNLLRLDFSVPENQVIVTDGKLLTIYYPKLEVIFEQKLKNASEGSFVAFGSLEGLYYLKNNYSISYLVGPQAVPLDNFSEELVVKLKLSSRSTSEGFRQLEIAIDRGNLIRRVSGLTVGFKEHRFDFLNIRTNQNIPDARFEYDSPPFANVYQNFLYQPEN